MLCSGPELSRQGCSCSLFGHSRTFLSPMTVQTVVPSVISSGNSTGLQTFDAPVHTDVLRFVPKFQSVNQMVDIKEVRLSSIMSLRFGVCGVMLLRVRAVLWSQLIIYHSNLSPKSRYLF